MSVIKMSPEVRAAVRRGIANQYPHCHARGVMTDVSIRLGDVRIGWLPLLNSFTPAEKAAWDRSSLPFPRDDGGLFPVDVEKFLSTLKPRMEDDDMATATKATPTRKKTRLAVPRKKAVKKRPACSRPKAAKKKSAVKPAKTKDSAGLRAAPNNGKFAPNQQTLPGVEGIRIEPIDKLMKRITERDAAYTLQKVTNDKATEDDLNKIGKLMRENELEKYSSNGKIAFVEHGIDVVRIKKAPKPKKPK